MSCPRACRDASRVLLVIMKALVSWEDAAGATHRQELAFDNNDAEARHFIEALQLHVRFRLDAFDAEAAADAAAARAAE
jgi:hypothetical protein